MMSFFRHTPFYSLLYAQAYSYSNFFQYYLNDCSLQPLHGFAEDALRTPHIEAHESLTLLSEHDTVVQCKSRLIYKE